ncbi:Uncharacterised protein (plasmid) [Tsukamurella tyrosinosolvens]|uniref:Uncharacterized protein n=1 Tax=Tsukamurella tyrosinosolvens TaxID=57704 RepID=A0A1H4Z1L8_TSUTY|nr:hypothetical protein [Tsukamurella tyrosinosolvens]KXO90788.1 hypothetical protein AXK58_22305 [Tsukamurella tyrosinosolvens]QRY84358.1 hypothetical protein JVY00_21510 [Tsukamurella tyrosinosolvens]SED23220.1 hypothetical protein SAMN04489793_4371 [Tsukamurella tyrosinosolvens]VEH91287.1 Uncharacterised protein [Tsukamurella tyrosinosolvens]
MGSGSGFFVPTTSAVMVFAVTAIVAPSLGLLRARLPGWSAWAGFAAGVLAGIATAAQQMSFLLPLGILAYSLIALVGWARSEHWAGRFDAGPLGRGALFHAYGLGAFFAAVTGLVVRLL